MDKLQQAREAISRIDGEMADLFVRRMEAAAQVAENHILRSDILPDINMS